MSLENEFPESFIGSVAAFEGVSDGYTVIHGPSGCKLYPSSLMEDCYFRGIPEAPSGRNPLFSGAHYFFGQPRVPCTYLDMGTFITGAPERLKELVGFVEGMHPKLISIINSPGASLVGEDLTAVKSDIPLALMDHPVYSGTEAEGFQDGVLRILDVVAPDCKSPRKGVNLTGISITHLNWEDTIADLTSLLGVCGIEVNMCIGAGWGTDDIRRSADAELIVPIYPEYGDAIAARYSADYGVPSFVSPDGAPIGFDALETWVKGVCGCLKKDPSPALALIHGKRVAAAGEIRRMEARHSLPKGRTFALECGGSTAYAIARFLYGYLGMIPVGIRCTGGDLWDRMLGDYLDSLGIPVSDEPETVETDIIISSGPVCSAAVERGSALEYAVIERPPVRTVNINPAPTLGLVGTVSLLESVLEAVSRHHRFL